MHEVRRMGVIEKRVTLAEILHDCRDRDAHDR
jgi:hypothetical protein